METNKIQDTFNLLKNKPSDINEHLETIKKYASECDVCIEMGVRYAVTTWAFLASTAKKIISYDIRYDKSIEEVIEAAKMYDKDFTFIEVDVLKIDIINTDLLFIDTLHSYSQLSQELEKHSSSVSKYIILHDTETFGYRDESIYSHASDLASKYYEKEGLKPVISDFLASDIGSSWRLHEEYKNNNGLTILKKI